MVKNSVIVKAVNRESQTRRGVPESGEIWTLPFPRHRGRWWAPMGAAPGQTHSTADGMTPVLRGRYSPMFYYWCRVAMASFHGGE